jgi:hypothetical protein
MTEKWLTGPPAFVSAAKPIVNMITIIELRAFRHKQIFPPYLILGTNYSYSKRYLIKQENSWHTTKPPV